MQSSFDSGSLRRVLELAADAVNDPALARVFTEGRPPTSLGELAELVGRSDNSLPRVRALSAGEVGVATRFGATVLVPVATGWLVATPERSLLVTCNGEQPLRERRLADGLGREPMDALVIEPLLPLQGLRQTTPGASPWGRLGALLRIEPDACLGFVVYAVVLGAASLAVPVAAQVLVNTIALGSLLQPLVVLAVVLCGVLTFAGVLQLAEWRAVEVLQRRVFVRVAEDFARRMAAMSPGLHRTLETRELANRFFDVVAVQKALGLLALDGLGLALQTLVALGLLATYHPVLLLFALGFLIALAVVVALGRGAVATASHESNAKYEVAAWLETLASNPLLQSRSSARQFAAERADALTRNYLHARRQHYRTLFRQLCGGVLVQVGSMTALFGLGGWLVMKGELTLGQLVAAEIVVSIIAAGYLKLGKQFETTYDLLAALDKLGKILDLPRQPAPRHPAPSGPRGLLFDQLVPLPSGTPITARVAPGQRVRLSGDGASGKTVFLEVVAGWLEPVSGQIRLQGSDRASESESAQRREATMLVGAEPAVSGTLLDNLRVVRPDLDSETAWSVLRTVKLGDTVEALPDKLDTEILANGSPLSSSELNRLRLARVLLAQPAILLVDGAFDDLGLAPEPRRALVERFLGPGAPWTALVATRDPEVARWLACDITLDTPSTGEVLRAL